MRKSNLPFHKQSLLDQEATKKRLKAEETEKIEVLGQESERLAKPWIQQEVSRLEKEQKEFLDRNMEVLRQLAKKKKKDYFRHLGRIFLEFCKEEYISRKYGVQIDLTDKGLELRLQPTRYTGAIKFSGIPYYDIHAVKRLAIKLGNTVAKLQGHLRKTEAGVIVPDQEDIKLYGRSKS